MYNDFPPFGLYWATNSPFPFPLAGSKKSIVFPYIAFNPEGQCLPILNSAGFTDSTKTGNTDVFISLANGVINYARQNPNDPTTPVVSFTAQEIPPGNSTNAFNIIHIDWLTGRARLERADVVKQ